MKDYVCIQVISAECETLRFHFAHSKNFILSAVDV